MDIKNILIYIIYIHIGIIYFLVPNLGQPLCDAGLSHSKVDK